MSSSVDLQLLPYRAALLADSDNNFEVLVRASAPAQPPMKHARLPLNLSLVIDRSGSMSGRPLHEAKRCAGMIIDSLAPTDTASLVVYDQTVDVLVASRSVQDRDAFHQALRGVESGGQTALHAGWLRGAEQAAIGADGPAVSRVLLLSDGQANAGTTNVADIAAQCGKMAASGVSTSTYGLGQNFNEDLMVAMARAGQGNPYYGRSAEDLIDPFRQEFDLMSALCARELTLELAPAGGVRITVLNDYPTDAQGRSRLPDLAYGGEAWALLQLHVPRGLGTVGAAPTGLFKATLHHRDANAERQLRVDVAELNLPTLAPAAFAAVAVNEVVARRAAELRAARLQEQARDAARAGDWATVERLLGQIRTEAEHSPWLAATIVELEKLVARRETEGFSKEALYSSRKLMHRIASVAEQRDWSEDSELQTPSFLRRKREQGRKIPE
jgi:Ca-activated chloride channel family protein